MSFKKYIEELKRRHVIKSGIAYLIVAWLVVQVASIVLPVFEAPPYVMKVLLFVLAIGLPINLVFAWVYDITPDGIKKTASLEPNSNKSRLKNSRLNKVIIVSLSLAVVVLLVNQFWGRTDQIETIDPVNNSSLPYKGEKSIAVLPFQNLSPDDNDLYYCNGIMQNVINDLSRIPDFIVLPSRTTNLYKDTQLMPTELGEELGVHYLLDGTFQKIESQIRVSLALTNTYDGRQIWTFEKSTFSLPELIDMQAEIAKQVANQLKTTLSNNLNKTLQTAPTNDEDAFDYYLRGKEALRKVNYATQSNKANANSLTEAKLFFDLAIERDTNFALAYLGLARTKSPLYYDFEPNLIEDSSEVLHFEKLVNKALQLNPELSDGYYLRGKYSFHVLNSPPEAEEDWGKALDINANNYEALYAMADLNLSVKANVVEAVRILKEIENRTIDEQEIYTIYRLLSMAYSNIMDPEMEWYYLEKCNKINDTAADLAIPWYLSRTGQPDKAITELTKRFPDPDNQYKLAIYAAYNCGSGQFEEAIDYYEQLEKLVDVESADNWYSIFDWHRYGQALMKVGKVSQGKSLIRRQISIYEKMIEKNPPDPPYYDMAGIYSFLNKSDSAYYYLDKFYETDGFLKSWGIPSFIHVDYQFDNIRSDTKFITLFEALKARMKEIRKEVYKVDPSTRELE